MKKYIRQSFLFLAVLFLCGCASTAAIKDDNSKQITLSKIENHLGGSDPWEGFNRSMFAVTSFIMDYIARPVGIVYTSIVPRPVITHIRNICLNLEYPTRALSCLLRAHWQGAGDETLRFLVNSTVGIGGIFDPAEYWLNLHSTESDFGQTFAAWGIAPGETLTLPLSPAHNVRDTAGLIFDIATDLKTYIPYAGETGATIAPYASAVTTVNNLTLAHDVFKQVVSDSNDRYKNYRQTAMFYRELQLRMFRYNALNTRDKLIKAGKLPHPLEKSPAVVKPEWLRGEWLELKDYGPGSPVQDSLRTLLFRAQDDTSYWYMPQSVFNNSFSNRRKDRSLVLSQDRPELTYAFWSMPEPEEDKNGNPVPRREKLAILLPGIGGTAPSATPTAFAELLNKNGYAVLVIDSTFTWQFTSARPGCRLPGFLPDDARAVRKIIKLALSDLKKDELISNPEIILTGYSFGGMHTLKIAELEKNDPQINFKKYLAVNPPVSLAYAAIQADKMAESMNKYQPQQVIDKIINTAGILMADMANVQAPFRENMSDLQKGAYRLQADPETAAFLAGLYFRSSMRNMLFAAHSERGLIPLSHLPVEFTRNRLYLELDKITFKEYAEKYLASEYPGVKLDTLYSKSNLNSLADTLKNDEKVYVLHSINDFLLSENDRIFLDSTLGRRITWTSRGGHLGNLYYEKVQQKILKMLE